MMSSSSFSVLSRKTISNSMTRNPSPFPFYHNKQRTTVAFFLFLVVVLITYGSFVLHATTRPQQIRTSSSSSLNQPIISSSSSTTTHTTTSTTTSTTTTTSDATNPDHQVLILSLQNIGDIQIRLRPDWSKESIDYIHQIVDEFVRCQPCNLYRAEKPGIVQGILSAPHVSVPTIKGTCPIGAETVPNNCPPWDIECGCHGPIMQRGYVAWAAGKTGPDFFIDTYPKSAVWWGTQHTVWGEIRDTNSLKLIDEHIYQLPTHKQGGLTMLNQPIHFDLSWAD